MHHRAKNVLTSFFFILPGCSSSDSSEPEVAPSAPLEPAPMVARPAAPAPLSVCDIAPEGVVTIERPMFPGRANSPTFGYSFKVHPGTDPEAPTVIHLPGGPGETSIDVERTAPVPETYTLIQTDPRGMGCNAPEATDGPSPNVAYYPDEFYDSTSMANDVLGVVQELGLDNYILYGISYGTLLATVTASLAEREGMTPPRAVVLEGVLGEAFARDGQAEESFQAHWRAIRDRLPEAIRTQLLTEPLPLGLSAEQWGNGLVPFLSLATVEPPFTFVEAVLGGLLPEASEEEREFLRQTLLEAGEVPLDPFALRLHEALSCHELTETNFRTLSLIEGELVRTEAYCTNEPLDRPYAAADWPLHQPIYYFSGTDDPNTPPWQAQAHYEAMDMAPRELVSIIAAGHNPLVFNLEDCQPALWAAIRAGEGFADAVAGCAWGATDLIAGTVD